MKHQIAFVLLLSSLLSCNNEETKDFSEANGDSSATNITRPEKSVEEENLPFQESDTIIKIKFDGFTVIINRLLAWEDENQDLKNSIEKDTVIIYPELGESIEGQKIYIHTTELEDFTVEQSYETSLSIGASSEHYDLINWQHYNSDWKILKNDSLGNFIGEIYNKKDVKQFPKINFTELKSYVKKEIGEPWYSIIKNMNSIDNENLRISMSRIYLRIKGKNRNTGETLTKIIAIEIPLGC